MPYHNTYNQLIRHARAKTSLVNLVLDCERVVDYILPAEASRNGLSELTADMGRSVGPVAVCMNHDSLSRLTVQGVDASGAANLRLGTAGRAALLKFHREHGSDELFDLLAPAGGCAGTSPLSALRNEIREKEKDPSARVILVARDVVPRTADERRILIQHAKEQDTAMVVLVTTDPLDDPVLRSYMPVINGELPSKKELWTFFVALLSKACDVKYDESSEQVSALQQAAGALPDKTRLYLNGGDTPVTVGKAAEMCSECLSGLHIPTATQILRLHLESPGQRGLAGERGKGSPGWIRLDPGGLSREKAEILNKAGYVSLVSQTVQPGDIGGMDELKKWLASRHRGFSAEAQAQHMRSPRGVVLVGPPGTAKSTTAKLAATMFKMPLIRLDMGALFNSHLGNSERNMRNALQVADASSPCVLLLDELDKSMGGMGGESDGGTSSRLKGSLLTWLEKV